MLFFVVEDEDVLEGDWFSESTAPIDRNMNEVTEDRLEKMHHKVD